MTQQLAPERPAQAAPGLQVVSPTGLVAAAAAVRGAAVAASGLILATGLATLIWAMTPASGPDVAGAMRGGVVGFAAANLMPVGVGGVTLSLPPLLFTLALVGLLASTARRGRFLPEGRYQETVSVLITALVYGVIVAATTRGFGPPGAVGPQWVWTASAIALLATGGAMLQRGSAWHEWWSATVPAWLRTSVRGGGVGLGVLLSGGGLAVTVGLISHFGDAVSVASLAAPSWMDGLGLSLLGLAYLPNAVVAGAGYVTGVGFEIGPGTYSPFATVSVDLPAVPLFAAVPDAAGRSWLGLIFLAVPVAAAYLVSRTAITRLATRADRSLAAALGAVLTGGLLAAAVAIARGGVGDGRWSSMGSPPLLIAAAVTVEVGVIAVALAALTDARSVPWRVGGPTSGTRPETTRRTVGKESAAKKAAKKDAVSDQGAKTKRSGRSKPTSKKEPASKRGRSTRRSRSADSKTTTAAGAAATRAVPPGAVPPGADSAGADSAGAVPTGADSAGADSAGAVPAGAVAELADAAVTADAAAPEQVRPPSRASEEVTISESAAATHPPDDAATAENSSPDTAEESSGAQGQQTTAAGTPDDATAES